MMADSMMKIMKIYLLKIEIDRIFSSEKEKSSSKGEYRVQTESTTEWLTLGREVL